MGFSWSLNTYGGVRAKGRQLIQRLVSIHKFLQQSGSAEKTEAAPAAPIDYPSGPGPEVLQLLGEAIWIVAELWGADSLKHVVQCLIEFRKGRAQQTSFSMNGHGYSATLRATRSNACA